MVRSEGRGLRLRWLLDALSEQTLDPGAFDVVVGGEKPLTTAPTVFLDDRCRPEPDWLTNLVEAARLHPGFRVRGRLRLDPLEPVVSMARKVNAPAAINVLLPAGRSGAPLIEEPGAVVNYAPCVPACAGIGRAFVSAVAARLPST